MLLKDTLNVSYEKIKYDQIQFCKYFYGAWRFPSDPAFRLLSVKLTVIANSLGAARKLG